MITSAYLKRRLGKLTPNPGPAPRAHLSGVVTCVSADVVYEEPARSAVLPGLLAQLAPGCVDAVVLVPAAAENAEVRRSRGGFCRGSEETDRLICRPVNHLLSRAYLCLRLARFIQVQELIQQRIPSTPIVKGTRSSLLRAGLPTHDERR